jgi:hypothetical protein
MICHIFNKIIYEDNEIKIISENIEKYYLFFQDVSKSPIGKYSVNNILETVEESLNYLEIFGPVIKKWINEYLEKHRGTLWLYYGIRKGSYLSDYWKISETNTCELKSTWPFLYDRTDTAYKGFIIDLEQAQSEILRQRARQSTSNPKYTAFHPDGCSSGCSCWMLDDMEQWYKEEQEEIEESKNIFFNGGLQTDFYKVACDDLELLKEQWINWNPSKSINTSKKYTTDVQVTNGQTPIKIILDWVNQDFYYAPAFTMFHWSDVFQEVWKTIDHVDDFIKIQREKLKRVCDLL